MKSKVLETLMELGVQDLKRMQAWPLNQKIEHAKAVIIEWYEHWDGKVIVSFSGGKDSTVLLHLVRSIYPDVPAMFVNTGLEYPDIKRHVNQFDNVVTLRPAMSFHKVLIRHGYPIISKKTAHTIQQVQRAWAQGRRAAAEDMFDGVGKFAKGSLFNLEKYKPLLTVDFKISDKCCGEMKHKPIEKHGRETGVKSYVGTMAAESQQRRQTWIKYGCNMFDAKNCISKPLSIWTEQDVLAYTVKYDLPIAKPYGSITCSGCQYMTTGCARTGCVFCGFGAHLDKGKRFEELGKLEPRLYDYCIGGGEYDENGLWIPNKNGLGFGHVYDTLNKLYGSNFVKYQAQQKLF